MRLDTHFPGATLVIELKRQNEPESAFTRPTPSSRKSTEVKSQVEARNHPPLANGWPEDLLHEFGKGSMDLKPGFGRKLLHFHICQRIRDEHP